jgi:hypothetical protein
MFLQSGGGIIDCKGIIGIVEKHIPCEIITKTDEALDAEEVDIPSYDLPCEHPPSHIICMPPIAM